jgi:hypothetical protein
MGLLVVDKENIGAVTNLAGNVNRDWLWYSTAYPDQGTTNPQLWPRDGHAFDIRSKRRTADMDRTLALCFDNHNGAVTMPVSLFVRSLVALP